LRRRRQGDRRNPGNLCRHDIHDDARGEGSFAAWNIEANAINGLPALVHGRTRTQRRSHRSVQLSFTGSPNSIDGRFEGVSHLGVQACDRRGNLGWVNTHPHILDAIKGSRMTLKGHLALASHLVDEPLGRFARYRDIHDRSRDQAQQFSASRLNTAQVNCLDCALDHGDTSLSPGVAGSGTPRS
jgi:hypothetical protein